MVASERSGLVRMFAGSGGLLLVQHAVEEIFAVAAGVCGRWGRMQ